VSDNHTNLAGTGIPGEVANPALPDLDTPGPGSRNRSAYARDVAAAHRRAVGRKNEWRPVTSRLIRDGKDCVNVCVRVLCLLSIYVCLYVYERLNEWRPVTSRLIRDGKIVFMCACACVSIYVFLFVYERKNDVLVLEW
jgi:hypothetical protein